MMNTSLLSAQAKVIIILTLKNLDFNTVSDKGHTWVENTLQTKQ